MRFTNGRHTIYMSKESKDKQFVTEITPQAEDFSRWYIDVIKKRT